MDFSLTLAAWIPKTYSGAQRRHASVFGRNGEIIESNVFSIKLSILPHT